VLPESVRLVIIGGEAASPRRIRGWNRHVQSARLLNTYGPTEATVVATYADIGGTFADEDVPIGLPLAGVRALLCDERGRVLEERCARGELYLSGKTLASGYLRSAEQTAQKFVQLRGEGRAYRTGDLVERTASGVLLYRGRVDDELKLSGVRIAPGEVERALEGAPGVRAAVVLGETAGEGAKHLVAHVEGDRETLDQTVLRTWLASQLPAAMVPSRVEIHLALPRTSSGKLDRRALRAMPQTSRVEDLSLDEPQRRVVNAWREVLGLPEVALDDDFFALGGHSLQVIQLANRLSTAARSLRVSEIFRHPTPRRQALLLSAESDASTTDGFRPWDVRLDDLAVRQGFEQARAEGPRRVLLTGATGFVGVHLLSAWLTRSLDTVVCLVRARSEQDARARLVAEAERFGIQLTHFAARIELVVTDLAQASADVLVTQVPPCAAIVHCAAQVSLTRDYESLARVNVLATRELLVLAGRFGASFHYVSSVATAPLAQASVSEQLFPLHAGLADGYQRSKWHCETLCGAASELGLPVAVYRLGRVVAPRERPVIHESDLAWRIARTATRVSAWPDLPFKEPWIPADEACTALVELALHGSAETPASVYHLTHTGSVSLEAFRAALCRVGFELPVISVADWIACVAERGDDDDRSTAAFFEMGAARAAGAVLPEVEFSCTRVLERLPALHPRPIDQATLAAFCEHALSSGFLVAKGKSHAE
jgi:nonribosomal peptide synthetase MxcG